MYNSYQQLSEMIDNCLSVKPEEVKLALVEKDIILEKIRKLYLEISNLETEEYVAPEKKENISEEIPETTEETQKQYTPAPTLEEDVDLFFDTEHESYEVSNIDEKLNAIAEEIQSATETQDAAEPEPIITLSETEEESDLFENLEEDTQIVVEDIVQDNVKDLFSEEIPQEKVVGPAEPQQITVEKKVQSQPQPNNTKPIVETSEDDILQFNQQKKNVEKHEPRPQRSLNDLFNEHREDNSISGQYQRAKVGDLTKAISINDKFTYIRELFHNKGEDFSAAIKKLNDCKNIGEAFDCLENLKQKYYWDSSSDAYLSFCDLLRRKYS